MRIAISRAAIGLSIFFGVCTTALVAYLLFKDEDQEDIANENFSARITIKMPIPKDAIGTIIGKRGSTVKDIQRKTGTKITISNDVNNENDFCYVTIMGISDDVIFAQEIINDILHNRIVILTEKIFVNKNDLGHIIGRNGSTIKSISQKTGAKIFVQRNSSERYPIEIIGSQQQIDYAKDLIDGKLKYAQKRNALKFSIDNDYRNKAIASFSHNSSVHSLKYITGESLVTNSDSNDIEIYVSYVESPSVFWVQLVGAKSSQLDKLYDRMKTYYEQNNKIVNPCEIKIGDVMAAFFDNLWHRVQILKINEDAEFPIATVRLLDHGGEFEISCRYISELLEEFTFEMPPQAIKCSLAGVKPIGDDWKEETCHVFANLVRARQWVPMFARLISLEDGLEKIYVVDLIDYRNENGTSNIAKELVNQKLALPCEGELNRVENPKKSKFRSRQSR